VILNHQDVEDVYPGHMYTFFIRKDGSAFSFGYNNVYLNFLNSHRTVNLAMEQNQQEVHQYLFLSAKTKIFQEWLFVLTTPCL
jgi:hypothetical protein